MMSMNEELQSANEELTTANEELKNKIDELTLANADLDNFVQSADIAMVVLDRAMRIRHVTDAARKIVPLVHTDKGRLLSEFNIDFQDFNLLQAIPKVLHSGEPITKTTVPDHRGKAFFIRVMPYFFQDSSIEGVTVTMVDISEETRLRTSLEQESRRLKLALEAGRMGLAELDLDNETVTIDTVLANQFGLKEPGDVALDALLANVPPNDAKMIHETLSTAMTKGEGYEIDFPVNIPNLPESWVRTRGLPYVAADGRKKIVGHTLEVTAEKHQDLILREMSHRVKNLFAVIGALIQLSPKDDAGTKAFSQDLLARVVSLGDAYDLARKQHGLKGVGMRELLDRLISTHLTSQTLSLEGPDVMIGAGALNTLTLLLHELTTNAIKHGALSISDGKLSVEWRRVDDRMLRLEWRETHSGVQQARVVGGFGSKLLERGIKQLNGQLDREITPNGMTCVIQIDISEPVLA
jgi:two-component system CheB/CheR fusion protein